MDVSQPIPAALVFEDQPLVVDPQQVHQRRLEVVYVHRVAGDVVAEFVRLAYNVSAIRMLFYAMRMSVH